MSQEQRLLDLANGVAQDIKALRTTQGDPASLSTTAKANLVAAINEVFALAQSGADGAGIDDTAGTGDTTVAWSADKIVSELAAAISSLRQELLGGEVDAALDTFAELQARLADDQTLAASFSTALTKRVRFDAEQVLTEAEKLQACTNIGIGNPEVDLLAAYNAAKV